MSVINNTEQERIRVQISDDNAESFVECVRSYLKIYPNQPTYSSSFENFILILKERGLYDENEIDTLRHELVTGRFDDPQRSELLKKQAVICEKKSRRNSPIGRFIEQYAYKSMGSFTDSTDAYYEDDLPGRRDPLFLDALKICITAKQGSTSLLQRHLKIGYGRAAAMLDAMVRDGLVGEMDGDTRGRPVFISSVDEIGQTKVGDETCEAFQDEAARLVESPDYIYVERFAKKFTRQRSLSEKSNLRNLLEIKGYRFSDEQLNVLLDFAVSTHKRREAKSRILEQQPFGARGTIQAYLNLFSPDDEHFLEVLKEIVEEKGLFHLFENRFEVLRQEVNTIQKELEIERFQQRLLADDREIPGIEEIDGYSGQEFENFLTELFAKMGYSVEQTRVTGDQGADIVAIKFGEKIVIQAKRLAGNVGNYAVQEIMAAISYYQAERGMVITNSLFTSAARELATANNIQLIDRNGLEELLVKHW